MNVKSAFRNDDLQEEVYVTQPEGFIIKTKKNNVYNLSKIFYNLPQAQRAWNIHLDKHLKSLNYMKCSQEHVVYTRNHGAKAFIVGVYVDKLIITDTSVDGIQSSSSK